MKPDDKEKHFQLLALLVARVDEEIIKRGGYDNVGSSEEMEIQRKCAFEIFGIDIDRFNDKSIEEVLNGKGTSKDNGES